MDRKSVTGALLKIRECLTLSRGWIGHGYYETPDPWAPLAGPRNRIDLAQRSRPVSPFAAQFLAEVEGIGNDPVCGGAAGAHSQNLRAHSSMISFRRAACFSASFISLGRNRKRL